MCGAQLTGGQVRLGAREQRLATDIYLSVVPLVPDVAPWQFLRPSPDVWAYRGLSVAVNGQNEIYMADNRQARVFKIGKSKSAFSGAAFVFPSADGGEFYSFDSLGRHLGTTDADSGAIIVRFEYSDSGLLNRVIDTYGNTTTLERDAAGNVSAIRSADGVRNTMTYDSAGRLATVVCLRRFKSEPPHSSGAGSNADRPSSRRSDTRRVTTAWTDAGSKARWVMRCTR